MIKVKDFMTSELLKVRKTEKVLTVAKKLEHSPFECAIITERNKPVGIVSERDLIKFFAHTRKKKGTVKIQEIMTSPVITIESDKTLTDAINLVKQKRIKQIPVLKKNKLIGIINEDDIIKGSMKSENKLTKKLVAGRIKEKTYAKKQEHLFEEIHQIKAALKQVTTGSKDLDKFFEGGLPYGRNTFICGTPGSGKTVFAYSFIAQGLREGDLCVYSFSNETEKEITEGLKFVGLENTSSYKKKGQLEFLKLTDPEDQRVCNITSDITTGYLFDIKKTINKVISKRKNKDVKIRFVFNTLLKLIMLCDSKTIYRFVSDLTNFLKEKEVTTIFLLQKGSGDTNILNAIEELMNVVVELEIHSKNDGVEVERLLRIKKAESANLSLKAIKFTFKKSKGFCTKR